MNWLKSFCISILLLLPAACDQFPHVDGGPANNNIQGFFLLNYGDEDGNNSTLDFYDYNTGVYNRDFFTECNPEITDKLGAGGNDMIIYGTRLYVAMTRSNFLEAIDIRTGWHNDRIPFQNCRYLCAGDGCIYVSSYGSDSEDNTGPQLGFVAKIDTNSLDIRDYCTVGYQPEEMAIIGNNIYVANSGINRVPNYDNTVSVIDKYIFREIHKIEVAPNLHRMEPDFYGNIWVSSRGDYYDIPSMTFAISTEYNAVCELLDMTACTDMDLCRDSLYICSNIFNNFTQTNTIGYAIVDVKNRNVVTNKIITDGTDEQIQNPTCIAVNPQTGEIFIADARDRQTPGKLYCFSKEGILRWSVYTGLNPCRIVFTRTRML
ncbi:MAG: YncE family protein [Bacteroidales bacterium]|nr:YncE family protein [Bacteroidales bacterium]